MMIRYLQLESDEVITTGKAERHPSPSLSPEAVKIQHFFQSSVY